MKFPSFINSFINRNRDKKNSSDSFSDFFHKSSPQEKEKVFRKVAEKANEDQRAVFEESSLENKSR
ncbi:MAG: hypothetical protein A2846_00925 [Candidatus Doudnabacteria bacterium RIFCSPHIGHO2_01_FULL_49_9]|uniref:Uncharacterized protein n=1 Tax=Candidatus Doudnabacteria bacterium RIFCSPHIGHO2_01_FULL_49_9 TaxID=1817827 RepID=A0A1F5P3I0_9BACT|nr:MAG: hypothetical protein A2846_00925 [Candidatus Doudnabacteria bacterium RIFCSPHIGHO2_01_FULL_49_9]